MCCHWSREDCRFVLEVVAATLLPLSVVLSIVEQYNSVAGREEVLLGFSLLVLGFCCFVCYDWPLAFIRRPLLGERGDERAKSEALRLVEVTSLLLWE
jgi:hypothetical protein